MILFCASDAGPGKNLAILIKNIGWDKHAVYAGAVSHDIFNDCRIKSELIGKPYRIQTIKKIINSARPKLIITGTSWGRALEKYFLAAANSCGIPSISIIENWSWYKERFILDGKLIFPEYIIVNDEIAKQEAINDGLPEKKIYPAGNMFLEDMAGRKISNLPKRRWLKELGLPEKKIVTFISEEYKNDFPKESEFYQGFDEYAVLNDILSVAGDNYHVLIKLHPSENTDKYDAFKRKNITIVNKIDNAALIFNSDFIIGMGSMFLIESSLHRHDIISYRPDEKIVFAGNKIGASYLITDKNELREVLSGKKKIKNRGLKQRFSGSTNRIAEFVMEKLK